MEKPNTVEEINIDEIIKRATKEAIKEYSKEIRKEQKNKISHNTWLLMKNYNSLKEHMEKGIDSLKFALVNGDYDELTEDEVYILSIKQSKAKTLIMIAHIDIAIETLKEKQYKASCHEKYRAFEKYFFDNETYEDIAEELNGSSMTIRRWINEMIKQLSVLIFGLDGLKLDMIS